MFELPPLPEPASTRLADTERCIDVLALAFAADPSVRWYRRLGCEVVAVLRVGTRPPITPMRRAPRGGHR